MRSLKKPFEGAEEVFEKCIANVRDPILKAALTSVTPQIGLAAVEFDAAATLGKCHEIKKHDSVGTISSGQMLAVYTSRMAKKGSSGRPIYDRLMTSPAHGRCPLCGQRDVSTLDHHLPKAHYPSLAVTPTNLVPACSACNKAKGEIGPLSAGEQTLNPYYDAVENVCWLEATLQESAPPAIRYYVVPHPGWDVTLNARVNYHFEIFDLASLYASHAAEEVVAIRYHLIDLYNTAGEEEVGIHLTSLARSHEALHLNSWQAALYRALAGSEWYRAGGFR